MNILVVSVIRMNILDSVVHKAPADARIVEGQYVHTYTYIGCFLLWPLIHSFTCHHYSKRVVFSYSMNLAHLFVSLHECMIND